MIQMGAGSSGGPASACGYSRRADHHRFAGRTGGKDPWQSDRIRGPHSATVLFELRMAFLELTNMISLQAMQPPPPPPPGKRKRCTQGHAAEIDSYGFYGRSAHISRHGNFDGGSHAGLRLPGLHLCRSARPAPPALGALALAVSRQAAASASWSSTPAPTSASRPCAAGLNRVDAVFYTHAHADHILGMDDLRPFSFTAFREGGPIPLYAAAETAEALERIFEYTFSPRPAIPRAPKCG